MWKWGSNPRLAAVLLPVVLTVAGPAAGEKVAGSYWYAVDNIRSASDEASVLVWVALPPSWHGQTVTVKNITPEPVAILEDSETGNRIIEWLVEPEPRTDLPELAPVQIFLHYDIELEEKPLHLEVDPAGVGPQDPEAEIHRRYTAPETWIQTDGRILDQAREIVGEQTNPYLQARGIYDWLLENLQFAPGQTETADALTTLTERKGDCSQFSLLFTALCRSIGIPARTVTSSWTSGGMHVFAEFHLAEHGWVPVDVSLGQMLMPGGAGLEPDEVEAFMARRNVPLGDPGWFFGNLFDNRIITTVGNNIRFDSPTLDHLVSFMRMAPGGVDATPEAFRIEGLNESIVQGGFYVFGQDVPDEETAHGLTHQRLANAYFQVELYDVVEDGCRAALDESTTGIQPWINLGKVYMHKGEYYKAESAFKRAIQGVAVQRDEKLESLIWTHNYLGNCYDMLGHRDLAVAEYQLVVDLANNYRGAVDYARKYLERPFDRAPAGD